MYYRLVPMLSQTCPNSVTIVFLYEIFNKNQLYMKYLLHLSWDNNISLKNSYYVMTMWYFWLNINF